MPRKQFKDKVQPVKKELSETTKKRKATQGLKSLSDKHLECRSYRYHALKKVRMFEWKDNGGKGICRISVCTRCGAHRDDYYNRKGELVDRRYDLPDGYSLKGYGYLTSDRVMREVFARAKDIAADEGDIPATARHLALVRKETA